WKKDHVARVFAASRSELGLSGSKRKLEMKTVGGTSCASASLIALDVVRLSRYANLPGDGWYSGDSHVHLMRDQAADLNVWAQMAAEACMWATCSRWATSKAPTSSSRRGIGRGGSSATITRSSPVRKIRARGCAATRSIGI